MSEGRESVSRTGVLVIRAWVEPDGPDGLRVRITSTRDVLAGERELRAAADVPSVLAIVERWLDDLATR